MNIKYISKSRKNALVIAIPLALLIAACSQNSYTQDSPESESAEISGKREVSVSDNYTAPTNYDLTKVYFEIVIVDKTSKIATTYQIQVNDTVHISDNVSMIVKDFITDFIINEDGTIATKTDTLSNPAVQVTITRDGEQTFDSWLFQLYPDIHPFVDQEYHIMYSDTLVESEGTETKSIEVNPDVEAEGIITDSNDNTDYGTNYEGSYGDESDTNEHDYTNY